VAQTQQCAICAMRKAGPGAEKNRQQPNSLSKMTIVQIIKKLLNQNKNVKAEANIAHQFKRLFSIMAYVILNKVLWSDVGIGGRRRQGA
jgi:hypothetical protein